MSSDPCSPGDDLEADGDAFLSSVPSVWSTLKPFVYHSISVFLTFHRWLRFIMRPHDVWVVTWMDANYCKMIISWLNVWCVPPIYINSSSNLIITSAQSKDGPHAPPPHSCRSFEISFIYIFIGQWMCDDVSTLRQDDDFKKIQRLMFKIEKKHLL